MRRIFVGVVAAVVALAAIPALATGGRPLNSNLDASQEVADPPVDSDGVATARLWLNQGQRQVCFFIEWSDLTGPVTAAHIHPGVAGVNGPPLVGFHGPPDDPGAVPVGSPLEGCVEADRDVIKDIRQNPHAYYLNLHTEEFPAGEVRGQLEK